MSDPYRTFNALVSELDYPMFVVTTAAGGERAGCLVGFATQSSIDPPRFLVCLSKQNRTYRVARDADLLAVHSLPADATDLAELFGGETGDRVDKFAQCDWRPGARAECRCSSDAATASWGAWPVVRMSAITSRSC